MVPNMSNSRLPKKLTRDSIREALVEIRFEIMGGEIPEIVIGRLVDCSPWNTWRKLRLPTADIPAAIRESDPALRFQPEIEVSNETGNLRVRVGGHAISIHLTGEYCGWNAFKPEVEKIVDALFAHFEHVTITRIGLRYINALTKEHHMIGSVSDLDLGISIGDATIADHINLSYFTQKEINGVMVKVVSPLFIQGQLDHGESVVVDVDVFTLDGYAETNRENITPQLEQVHKLEKEAFFALLPRAVIDELKEE